MGTVTIKEGATLDVSGQLDDLIGTPIGKGTAGPCLCAAVSWSWMASTIQANTVGAVDGASTAVDIQVSQDVALTNGSTIVTLTFGPGRGGDVQLTARTLTLENASQSILTATVDGGGVGGDVVLNVGTLSLMGGSSIQSSQMSELHPWVRSGRECDHPRAGRGGQRGESVALSGGSSLSSADIWKRRWGTSGHHVQVFDDGWGCHHRQRVND